MLIGVYSNEIEDELALAVSKYLESIGEEIKTVSKDGGSGVKTELDGRKGAMDSTDQAHSYQEPLKEDSIASKVFNAMDA